MSKPTRAQAEAAYAKLEEAADAFLAAITDFQKTYEPKAVGLNEWSESIDEVLLDLYDDIEENIEE